jgi:hypothetical protein
LKSELLKSEFCCNGAPRRGQNPVATEALKTHSRRSRDLTYALAAEWWEGNGKTAAGCWAFRPDLYQAQILTHHVRPFERLAAALRRTRGKLATSRLAA